MKKLSTLIDDIYGILGKGHKFNKDEVSQFGEKLGQLISDRLSSERQTPTLRLSNIGTPCKRKLWFSINTPELAERMPPATYLKFLLGDIAEAVILFLARASGHSVTDEQKEVSVNGVKGHIDAIIDGELVDVKSASPYSFDKFKDHRLDEPGGDAFGYLDQLGSYAGALGKPHGHFLATNKVLGSLCLDTWPVPDRDLGQEIEQTRAILASPEPPPRAYDDVEDGKSGNRRLGVACSYCEFKTSCWPGLRGFAYSNGPRYLTRVVREPFNVPEIKE